LAEAVARKRRARSRIAPNGGSCGPRSVLPRSDRPFAGVTWPSGRPLAEFFTCHRQFELEDRTLIVAPGGELYELDSGSRRLWDAILLGASIEDLISAVVTYGGSSEKAAQQRVGSLLGMWRNAGLLCEPSSLLEDAADREVSSLAITSAQPSVLEGRYQLGERAVQLRCYSSTLAPILEATLPPVRRNRTAEPQPEIVVTEDDGCFVVSSGPSSLEAERDGGGFTRNPRLARHWCLTGLIEASLPPRRLLGVVHASAVAHRDRCIALVGPAGTGKSILAAALVGSGARFITDDYLPLERRTWLVWPVPYPLSIKISGWAIASRYLPAITLAPTFKIGDATVRLLQPNAESMFPSGLPVSLDAIVFPERRARAPVLLERLSATESFARLCRAQSILDLRADALSETLRWIQAVPCYRLSYGDLDQAIEHVGSLLSEA
jgi:hypothetical protein